MIELNKIYCEDCLQTLSRMDDESVNCIVTSPPYYGLRDYGIDEQIGLEETPELYVQKLVEVFHECRRVLKKDGTLWLNLGDSYASSGERSNNNGEGKSTMGWPGQKHDTLDKAVGMKLPSIKHGLKPKDLIGIPWKVAFALQADGWWLRQDIIWHKPNPMPESVKDRCTKAHEYIFLLTKSAKYWYDAEAVKESVKREWDEKNGGNLSPNGIHKANGGYRERGGNYPIVEKANRRSVWTVTTKPFSEAHFATFPEDLIRPCILAGCPEGGVVYDPFMGAGTTALVAHKLARNWIGSELNPEYIEIANRRLKPYIDQLRMF